MFDVIKNLELLTTILAMMKLAQNNRVIEELAGQMVALHTFSYKTLAEAKKTIHIDNIELCFDALSLCVYHHTLNNREWHDLGAQLDKFYESQTDENKKERFERAVLFHYLQKDNCPYSTYEILKAHRPDFVLTGEKRVGIEVMRLTTEHYEVLNKISAQNFGKGKTANQIRRDAIKTHGSKATQYHYERIGRTVGIRSGLIDVDEVKRHFADQINGKRRKYANSIDDFDVFIILCDAQRRIEVSSDTDVTEIIQYAYEDEPRTHSERVEILWSND